MQPRWRPSSARHHFRTSTSRSSPRPSDDLELHPPSNWRLQNHNGLWIRSSRRHVLGSEDFDALLTRDHRYRPVAVLSLLAGAPRLLRCEHHWRGPFRQEEVWSGTGGLLRVSASQEGGRFPGTWRRLGSQGLTIVKQAARTRALQAAYRKAESASARDNSPSVGQIRNLGLIGKEDDTKAVTGS